MSLPEKNPQDSLPEHSPLGASGASRWMTCPGSVTMAIGIKDTESDFASLGTAAHALAEFCLSTGMDAWERIETSIDWDAERHIVDKDMADAVQTYLDAVRQAHPDRDQSNSFIERGFHCPSIHPFFYGRSDYTYIDSTEKTLHVWDYKHGAGIVVEAKNNPQGMYYACGMLTDLKLWGDVKLVVIHIAQPRGWHADGPLRSWTIPVPDLDEWLTETLIPAMHHAETSTETVSGEHCRFCPARAHACPQLMNDMDEMEDLMALTVKKGGAKKLSDIQVGRMLELHDISKLVAKAASETAFQRLQAGKKIPGRKLASARSNRVWKDGAEDAMVAEFGNQAMSDPVLLSPAKIDKLPMGSDFVARWAHKPDKGLTVVASGDARSEVSRDTKAGFTPVKKGRNK